MQNLTSRGELFWREVAVRRIRWALLLLAASAAFLSVTSAAADGKVFTPIPPQERGLQVDAALFSPQSARWPGSAELTSGQESVPDSAQSDSETYIVQPGDTLSEIAARFHVDTAVLASLNGLKNPDYIEVGQSLIVESPAASQPAAPPHPGSAAPEEEDLVRVQVWPWPPVQGQTLAVWLQARRPISWELRLDGVPYPVIQQDQRGWALLPIPSLAAPGDHSLAVAAGNTSVEITIPVQAGSFEMYHIPASVSRPILDQSDKVRAETARLRELIGRLSPSGWTPRSRFQSPLPGEYPHTSPYGSRRTYDPSPVVSAHEGEDLSAPAGTPVTAPAAGVVVLAEPLFVRGNAVVIDHGNGVFTGYWHMQELDVKPEDRVEAGDLLGRVGSTGLSTGAHLHWELRVDGVAVDPLQWLEK
jgi:murein DD-endopeptidase MepM/ murein hydrolase activator NlpD